MEFRLAPHTSRWARELGCICVQSLKAPHLSQTSAVSNPRKKEEIKLECRCICARYEEGLGYLKGELHLSAADDQNIAGEC